jgi:hypothetical protein
VRYLLQPKSVSVLSWLIRRDPEPKPIPVFPDDAETRLVVAHLLNGKCYAEVITDTKHLLSVCGKSFPFGRMFFHVKHVDLAGCCVTLPTPASGERP